MGVDLKNQKYKSHNCRPNCAACCIAPSISSPIPDIPNGKKAGEKCIHLSDDLLCELINSPLRPKVCINFKFDPIICGNTREEAFEIMEGLEKN